MKGLIHKFVLHIVLSSNLFTHFLIGSPLYRHSSCVFICYETSVLIISLSIISPATYSTISHLTNTIFQIISRISITSQMVSFLHLCLSVIYNMALSIFCLICCQFVCRFFFVIFCEPYIIIGITH